MMNEKYITDEEYPGYFGHLNGLRLKVALKMPISPGMRILDLACGYGFFAIEIARLFPDAKIVGIDISSGDVNNATDRIKRYGLSDRIKVLEMDSTNLDFPKSSFDLTANFLGLEDIHMTRGLEGVEKTFHEIGKVLKPGGYFCFTVMPPDAMETPAQKIEVALFSYICNSTWLESSEYARILKNAGFILNAKEVFLTGLKLTTEQAREEIKFACENVPRIYGIETPLFENIWDRFGGDIERHGLGHYSKTVLYVAQKK